MPQSAVRSWGSSPTVLVAAIFAVIGCIGELVPMFAALFGGQPVQNFFQSFKDGLIRHNAIIMTVLFTILGALQLGNALEGF